MLFNKAHLCTGWAAICPTLHPFTLLLELILYDQTIAYGPKMSTTSFVCLTCMKDVDGGFKCPDCRWPMCGEKCAGSKWHKDRECQILASNATVEISPDHYRAIAPLRYLLTKESHPDFYLRFNYLMDHNEERKKDEETWNLYRKFVNDFLLNDCKMENFFKEEDLDRSVGLFWTNAFACQNGNGQAIFPTFSFISHSCLSNSNHVVFPNKHLVLQAKTAVKKGEELTINYISPVQSTLRRKSKLRDKWFFECRCQRCSNTIDNHVSSLICQINQCGGVLTAANPQLDYWMCSKCGHSIAKDDILYLENGIAKELQEVEDQNDLDKFQTLYEQYKHILHKNHYLLLLLKRHIIILSSSQFINLTIDELKKIQHLCEEVLQVLNAIDPGCNRDRGVILRHMSEVKKLICRKLFQVEAISQEVFTRQVHECMILFEESQRCMSMLVKKE